MKTELLLRFLNVMGILMLILTFCLDCRFFYPSIILLVLVEQFQILRIIVIMKKIEFLKITIPKMFGEEL